MLAFFPEEPFLPSLPPLENDRKRYVNITSSEAADFAYGINSRFFQSCLFGKNPRFGIFRKEDQVSETDTRWLCV